MQIFNLNIFNNQNTSFKKVNTFTVLNKLPKTPCACCGAKTITNSELDKFWEKVTRPLSKIIIEGKLDFCKKKWPEAFGELAILAAKYPKESLDKILSHDNLFTRTAIFFQKLIESREKPNDDQAGRNLLLTILYATRKELRSSSVVMREAEKFEDSINESLLDVDKGIFKQLKIYAQKFPRMRLSKIIQQPEVYKQNKLMENLSTQSIIEERDFHFANILKMAPKEDVEYFKEVEAKIKEILSKNIYSEIKREQIKKIYSGIKTLKKDKKLMDKILKEIDKMPMSLKTKESFFAYSATKKYNDNAIIGSILEKHLSTFDHIVPKSKNGNNSIYNGVVMCKHCNQNRGTDSYARLIRIIPQMQENLLKQLKFVAKAIEKGKLPLLFDNYPIKIVPVIKCSVVENADFSDFAQKYAKKLKRKNNSIIKKNSAEIEKLSEEEKILKEKLEKIKEQKTKLYNDRQHAKSINQSIETKLGNK